MGRWIDFKNDYKTLYPWYMESIWWVFRQLWDKGLIYKGNLQNKHYQLRLSVKYYQLLSITCTSKYYSAYI